MSQTKHTTSNATVGSFPLTAKEKVLKSVSPKKKKNSSFRFGVWKTILKIVKNEKVCRMNRTVEVEV